MPSFCPYHPPASPAPRRLADLVSSEAGAAATHNITLANQLSIELAAIEGEVDVEVDAVEGALRGVHPLKVLFEVLSRQITGEGHDFFDARVFGVFCRDI